jgi:phosphoribosylformylglycinamidine synthase
MAVRIEIATVVFDSRAAVRKKKFSDFPFANKIHNVFIIDVYTTDKNFTQMQLEKLGAVLCNPVTQTFHITPLPVSLNGLPAFDWAIEIGFLPGVTDNIAHTVKEIATDLLKESFTSDEDFYTSQTTYISGKLSKKEVEQLADNMYNPLIQQAQIKSYSDFTQDGGMDIIIPKVILKGSEKVAEVDLDIPDEQLALLGKAGILNEDGTRRGPLALDLTFMKTIRDYFHALERKPTDIELESIAQTWSEHCKHTIFADPIDNVTKGLFKTYIKQATEDIRKKKGENDFCISVFTDNSGGIALNDEWMITHKAETHNSPSALDPFGGAITGIVGVNRDALGFGLGAKPVANYYGFCLADPKKDVVLYRDKKLKEKMLSSRRIMNGVVDGVNAGGNQSGIPTPQGFVYFDESYRGKPLIFVGTIGIIPRKIQGKPSHVKKAQPGDLIVMAGGRVGKDGIHGATFSSEAIDTGSPATAVQIGDPITQKKMSDVLVKEARDMLLYSSITDNGAGGLSCSVAEMAKESGGCEVALDKVPLKYNGLTPWEIWISESQERMTLAVPKKHWEEFHKLMKKRGVEATIIGTFTNSGKCVVNYNGKTIMDIAMQFLHDGLPQRPMHTTYTPIKHSKPVIPQLQDLTKQYISFLSRLNIASYSHISQQYDYVVQANSVLPPLQGKGRVNADASAFRPVLTSNRAVVLSQGLYPTYSQIDTYHMAAASIDTAIRNAVAAGVNPDHLAILDNFCWTDSNNPESLGKLKRAAKACYDYAVEYGTPYISGKDSMFNDFKGFDKKGNPIAISVLPTLLISSIGVVNDQTKVVSLDAKKPGDIVYILGETFDELGGSEYFSSFGKIGNTVPQVNAKKNNILYHALYKAMQRDLVASSQSIHHGGLAVAIAKTAMGGMLGMEVNLTQLPGSVSRDDFALYSESQGRILVTVAPENTKEFERTMMGNTCAKIGIITKNGNVVITGKSGKVIIQTPVTDMFASYKSTFAGY